MVNAVYPVIGNNTAFPFYLTGIGTTSPEFNIKRDKGLVSHQFLFTAGGKGVLNIGESSYIQTEGSFFYLAPGVSHEYYPENGDWETCWVVFRGEHLPELMKTMGFGDFAVKNNACNDDIRRIFDRLMSAAKDPVFGAERCSMLVYEYILAARKILFGGYDETSAAKRLSYAALFIENHLDEDISIECLADASGISVQHLCRLFKKSMGMRPMEYLAHKRVAKAKLMLCNSTLSVSEVGAECGYNDPTYFGAVFKKYEGISPGEYRKREGSYFNSHKNISD